MDLLRRISGQFGFLTFSNNLHLGSKIDQVSLVSRMVLAHMALRGVSTPENSFVPKKRKQECVIDGCSTLKML